MLLTKQRNDTSGLRSSNLLKFQSNWFILIACGFFFSWTVKVSCWPGNLIIFHYNYTHSSLQRCICDTSYCVIKEHRMHHVFLTHLWTCFFVINITHANIWLVCKCRWRFPAKVSFKNVMHAMPFDDTVWCIAEVSCGSNYIYNVRWSDFQVNMNILSEASKDHGWLNL